jgi:hypothetical protein
MTRTLRSAASLSRALRAIATLGLLAAGLVTACDSSRDESPCRLVATPATHTTAAQTSSSSTPSIGEVLVSAVRVKISEGLPTASGGKLSFREFDVTGPDVAAVVAALGPGNHPSSVYPRSLCMAGSRIFTFYSASGAELASVRRGCEGQADTDGIFVTPTSMAGFKVVDPTALWKIADAHRPSEKSIAKAGMF